MCVKYRTIICHVRAIKAYYLRIIIIFTETLMWKLQFTVQAGWNRANFNCNFSVFDSLICNNASHLVVRVKVQI